LLRLREYKRLCQIVPAKLSVGGFFVGRDFCRATAVTHDLDRHVSVFPSWQTRACDRTN